MEDVPASTLRTIRQHSFSSSFGSILRLGAWFSVLLFACFIPLCRAQYGGARNPSMGTVSNGLPTYLNTRASRKI